MMLTIRCAPRRAGYPILDCGQSGRARRRSGGFELSYFVVGKDAAAREEPDTLGRFHGKSGAASGYDVDDKLCVPPIFELRGTDVKLAAGNFAEQHVLR